MGEPTSIAALKRRIAVLEEQNAELTSKMTRSPIHSWTREGRSIRRLVSLVDPVTDMVAEYDQRAMLAEDSGELDIGLVASTDEQDRMYRSFKKLTLWCPSLKKIMPIQAELTLACHELKKGADAARGDDANNLKHAVASWLNEKQPPPNPLLLVDDKHGRGFNHDVTGQLLCPVDFNWLDLPTRAAIREYDPNYAVTAHMWPSFLYSGGKYDPEYPSNGLFKGELLVRAFRCIFTSPSSSRKEASADLDGDTGAGGPSELRKHTRSSVATLVNMRSVQPRAIAYVAVQLRFALSSCSFWTIKDDSFDYEKFYHNVVDWFELPVAPAESREIERLLRWWDKKVFDVRRASNLETQDTTRFSVARSRTRR